MHISEMFRLVRGTGHILDVLDVLHRDRLALRIHCGAFSAMDLTARHPRTGELLSTVTSLSVQSWSITGGTPYQAVATAGSSVIGTSWSGGWTSYSSSRSTSRALQSSYGRARTSPCSGWGRTSQAAKWVGRFSARRRARAGVDREGDCSRREIDLPLGVDHGLAVQGHARRQHVEGREARLSHVS
ncbi:hypothetical protein ACFVXA_29910 [Streptomyces sp. NPDC058246]|uniref:hypothetical protein n=1 Tax=Streptomyces sp. NPDC058246 TaxID=3346400 RepID=UPI0036EEC10D